MKAEINSSVIAQGGGAAAVIPATDITRMIDPKPLEATRRNWVRWTGPAISLLILIAALYQLRQTNLHELVALLPASAAFWLVFAINYMATPFSEWVIFRRLWRLPVSGMLALIRKRVSNEILLGYSGEVYFYAWARRNGQITASPFGAIKDVTILSALAGNAVTIAMLAVSVPFIQQLHLGIDSHAFAWSAVFVMVTSMAMMVLRKSLFTLPRGELWGVTGIHLARIFANLGLTAYLWHLILPDVAIHWWLLLATFRQLLSRLPFLPNKDIVFAGLAVFLVGHDTDIITVMTLMASLMLATHLLLGAMLGMTGIIGEGKGA